MRAATSCKPNWRWFLSNTTERKDNHAIRQNHHRPGNLSWQAVHQGTPHLGVADPRLSRFGRKHYRICHLFTFPFRSTGSGTIPSLLCPDSKFESIIGIPKAVSMFNLAESPKTSKVLLLLAILCIAAAIGLLLQALYIGVSAYNARLCFCCSRVFQSPNGQRITETPASRARDVASVPASGFAHAFPK